MLLLATSESSATPIWHFHMPPYLDLMIIQKDLCDYQDRKINLEISVLDRIVTFQDPSSQTFRQVPLRAIPILAALNAAYSSSTFNQEDEKLTLEDLLDTSFSSPIRPQSKALQPAFKFTSFKDALRQLISYNPILTIDIAMLKDLSTNTTLDELLDLCPFHTELLQKKAWQLDHAGEQIYLYQKFLPSKRFWLLNNKIREEQRNIAFLLLLCTHNCPHDLNNINDAFEILSHTNPEEQRNIRQLYKEIKSSFLALAHPAPSLLPPPLPPPQSPLPRSKAKESPLLPQINQHDSPLSLSLSLPCAPLQQENPTQSSFQWRVFSFTYYALKLIINLFTYRLFKQDNNRTNTVKENFALFIMPLMIASTPIGNLKDITLRTLESLKGQTLFYAKTRASHKSFCRTISLIWASKSRFLFITTSKLRMRRL